LSPQVLRFAAGEERLTKLSAAVKEAVADDAARSASREPVVDQSVLPDNTAANVGDSRARDSRCGVPRAFLGSDKVG
jgi:hypothetical protein